MAVSMGGQLGFTLRREDCADEHLHGVRRISKIMCHDADHVIARPEAEHHLFVKPRVVQRESDTSARVLGESDVIGVQLSAQGMEREHSQ